MSSNKSKKRTINDFFSIDLSKQKTINGKSGAKRPKLDVEEVKFVKEVTKSVDNSYREVVNISSSQDSEECLEISSRPSYESPEQALRQVFSFGSFRSSLQENAIKCVINGKSDVFVSMPTGAGKSLCYQLPAVCDSNRVSIVVSPLIALIVNQISSLKKLSINAVTINSHLAPNEQKRIRTELMSSKVDIRLLYITPEMAATQGFGLIVENLYKTDQLGRIAIDEAHCVSQWGHDFRPDYLKLRRLKERYPKVVWIALTATASAKVVEDIITLLGLREPVSKFICPNFRPNLYYDVVFKDVIKEPIEELKEFVLSQIGPKDLPAPKSERFCTASAFVETSSANNNTNVGIIYCRTRAVCEDIASALSRFGIKANAYHAGMTAHQRKECQEKWMTGQVKCIIATVSFGMGVDKANVRFVVHWNVPQSLTGYYQESGRAGRDGKSAKCRIYYSIEDKNVISFLIKQDSEKKLSQSCSSNQTSTEMRESLKRFEKMIKYCETDSNCRHSLLLSEFVGDDSVVKTGCKASCDVCTHPKTVKRCVQEFESFQMSKSLKTKIANNLEPDDWSLPKYDEPQHFGRGDESEKEISMNDIIKQEFKRRNKTNRSSQNRTDSRNMGFRSATDVLEPTNQKIKDMNLTLRNQFVDTLREQIAKHYNEVKVCHKSVDLNDSQLTQIAAQFELSVYKTKNSKTTYRAGIAEFLRNLKKATDKSELHQSIREFGSSQNSDL